MNLKTYAKMLFLLFMTVFLIVSCNKSELSHEVVASIDGDPITLEDFKRAYIPVLLYSDKKETPESREEVLNYLIDQTILAKEAQDLKLDTIATLDVLRRTAEKTAFTRILYKEWVKESITTPSEARLRKAYINSHNPRLVRHLFTDDEEQAVKYYEMLIQGANWDSLAAISFDDPSLAYSGGVLGWMKFGDMDPEFERAVYDLEVHEISKPIQTQFGWHIIRVDEESKDLMLTEYDFSLERSKLERVFREREEKRLSDSVVNAMMTQANLQFVPRIAPRVWTVMHDQIHRLLEEPELEASMGFELQNFEYQLEPLLNEPMLTFGTTTWTVKDFLQKLPEMNRQLMLSDLKTATAFLVRDEIIYLEGTKRSLQNNPSVIAEVQDRENQFLSNLYLRHLAEKQPISEQVVRSFYKQFATTRYQAPDSLYIQQLEFLSRASQLAFLKLLEGGASWTNAHSNPEVSVMIKNLGWFQGAREDYANYYHELVTLPLKTLIHPQNSTDSLTYIAATQRRRHAKPLEQIYSQVRIDAENDRLDKLRLKEVQTLAKNHDIQIDLDKLHNYQW